MAFTGFTAVQDAPAVVTVGNGRLYHAGIVFFNDNEGGTRSTCFGILPVVTRRYVGVVVWGQEIETDTEPRTFLTDPVTRATVARVVSTETDAGPTSPPSSALKVLTRNFLRSLRTRFASLGYCSIPQASSRSRWSMRTARRTSANLDSRNGRERRVADTDRLPPRHAGDRHLAHWRSGWKAPPRWAAR